MQSAGDTASPLRLHVGCGDQRLDGWVNIDRQELPAVDLVADVTRGLPFSGAELVYAEHFLEHLPLDHALAFLCEAHRVLAPGGWLRLSTPNLDWVIATQYLQPREDDGARAALRVNRGFHGWSHRFLWNRELLDQVLAAVGFDDRRWCRWGESESPALRGLERHETYVDAPELPHVLIVDACKGEPRPARLAELRAQLEEEFLHFVRPLAWRIDPRRSRLVARLPLHGPLSRRLREHVIRADWFSGTVHFVPEAPEETRVALDIAVANVLTDEAAVRAGRMLPWYPARWQRRIESRVRGVSYLDAARWPDIGFRSTAAQKLPDGRLALRGDLSLRGAVVPIACEVSATLAEGVCRAEGSLSLRPSAFGLPPWRVGGGLLRGDDELLVDFDLVAEPVSPT